MQDSNFDSKDKCDIPSKSKMLTKKFEVVDGYTIKYHANGVTRWSKGRVVNDQPEGYWEWYRPDGSLKRSGYFTAGQPTGEWITYNSKGEVHKITQR